MWSLLAINTQIAWPTDKFLDLALTAGNTEQLPGDGDENYLIGKWVGDGLDDVEDIKQYYHFGRAFEVTDMHTVEKNRD